MGSARIALRRLAAEKPELGIDPGPIAPPFLSPGQIASGPELDIWLDRTAMLYGGMDRRSAAAYLLSILVWRLGEILGSLYLSDTRLPRLTDRDLAMVLRIEGTGTGRDIDFRFRFAIPEAGRSRDRATFIGTLAAIHEPLVAALSDRTGLSRRALWRLVGDGVSGGMLAHAKRCGGEEKARAEAEAIMASEPLCNRQWRFVEVDVAEQREWFRLRGGCCRLYHTPGGAYCSTCVVVPAPDRIEWLAAAIRRRRGA